MTGEACRVFKIFSFNAVWNYCVTQQWLSEHTNEYQGHCQRI